jgi:hypothetical protein
MAYFQVCAAMSTEAEQRPKLRHATLVPYTNYRSLNRLCRFATHVVPPPLSTATKYRIGLKQYTPTKLITKN